MRYFHIIGDLRPQRFWTVFEVTKERAKEVSSSTDIDGYIKSIHSRDMKDDLLLCQHFTQKQLKDDKITHEEVETPETS